MKCLDTLECQWPELPGCIVHNVKTHGRHSAQSVYPGGLFVESGGFGLIMLRGMDVHKFKDVYGNVL
jgi:hypothetical protein